MTDYSWGMIDIDLKKEKKAYTATCRQYPDLFSYGKNKDEVIKEIRDKIMELENARIEKKRAAEPVSVPVQKIRFGF